MGRHLAIGLTLAAALGAGAAAVSVAGGASTAPAMPMLRLQPGVQPAPARVGGLHDRQTLVLVLTSAQGSNVDHDPSGPSAGDSTTASGPLTSEGDPAGVLDVSGVLTKVGAQSMRVRYTLTLTLAHGQITAMASFPETNHTTGFRAEVVGGTLRYRNARGQVYVRLLQQGAQFTVRLQP